MIRPRYSGMIRNAGSTNIRGDIVISSANLGEIVDGATVIAEISTNPTLAADSALPTQKACKSYADSGDAGVIAATSAHTDSITVRNFGPTEFTGIGPENGIVIGALSSNQLIATYNDGFSFTATGSGTVRDTPPVTSFPILCRGECTFSDLTGIFTNPYSDYSMYEDISMRMYTCPDVTPALPATIGSYAGYCFPGNTTSTLFMSCLTPMSVPLGVATENLYLSIRCMVQYGAPSSTARFVFRSAYYQRGETVSTVTGRARNVTVQGGILYMPINQFVYVETRGPGTVVVISMRRDGAVDASTADIYALGATAQFRMATWGARSEDL